MYIHELDPNLVGRVITYYRKKKGLSQEVVSGLAGIGRTHLSAIERGERMPTLETFYRLCMALDTEMSKVTEEIERELAKEKMDQ